MFFNRHRISELRRPIAAKLCHVISISVDFIMHVQKFGALASPKNFGAKNMQNLGRSYTISDFDREYLRNEARYPKLERQLSDRERFLPRSEKSTANFGPLSRK